MIRILHRIGALLAALLMLWLAGTGSGMQLLDLKSILAHEPPESPTQLSIMEGMFGNGDFSVIQLSDFKAAAFPAGFDINKGMATVLRAAQTPGPNGGRGGPVSWIEMRVAGGVPIGQIMRGTVLAAFDAQTGKPVTAIAHEHFPEGQKLPDSLRQTIKTLHRFWDANDAPGVYLEFFSGLVLSGLLITGLTLYFRLLRARAKMGRRQWFWLTGGVWRGLHRSISVLSAVFLISIAFTGTWIGFESTYANLHRRFIGSGDQSSPPVRLEEVPAMTATTLEAMQRSHPGTPIKAIRLRNMGQMKQAVVISGGEKVEQLLFDTATGQQVTLTEPSYPKTNFPFGVQTHENIKHFHSGAMFGIPTRLMSLFGGLSLLFLSISGVVMYFDMWSQRRTRGRKSFFWAK